jgi:hypothetical protein
VPLTGAYPGFGNARIWDRRFSSKNVACNSIISQSSGVSGSMFTVWASGGSTCKLAVTFCPSERPSVWANVASISTRKTSCSRADVLPRVPLIPSLLTMGASLRLLGIPVHPTYMDLRDGVPLLGLEGLVDDAVGL